jgi:Domain of unknown function (DUF1929)
MGGMRRAWRYGLLAAVVVVAAACGTWRTTSTPSPLRAAHVALLHTGKVLLVAGSGADVAAFDAGSFKTSIWDPETETFQAVSTPWDAFCSGHAFLPDGRLLVAGGTSGYPSVTNGRYAGTNKAYIFDPETSRYQAAPNSAISRWYPTVVELGDGRLLTVGGIDENKANTRNAEIFNGTSWSAPKAPPAEMPYMPTYPALHLLRDGRLFFSGASVLGSRTTPPGMWNITTNAYQPVAGLPKKALRDEGMSVLLPPAQAQRVLILGGGRTLSSIAAVNSAAIADLSKPTPRYKATKPMDTAKLYVSAVILPDSTVLETGGAASAQNNGSTPVFSSEIFNPQKGTWTKAATHRVPRVYHSSALLLPDGRVATFGGNPSGSWEMRVEIYTPHYLETGTPRPTINSGPTEIRYGNDYTIGTAQTSALTSAVLVRPASVTHSSDSNQRLVNLPFTRTAGGLTFSVTGEPNLAPPGWYMLFVVDGEGVPSVAKWVHLA